MPLLTCSLDEIAKPAGCNDRGGLRAAYWAKKSEIDFAAMVSNVLTFTPATQLIIGYTMIGGAVFTPIAFEGVGSFYNFTYTRDTDLYEQLVTLVFKGKDNPRKIAFQKAILCCDIVVHLYGNAGEQRVLGVDYDGVSLNNIPGSLQITRHLDDGGNLGTAKAKDELDFGGQSLFAPLFANVAEADLPL